MHDAEMDDAPEDMRGLRENTGTQRRTSSRFYIFFTATETTTLSGPATPT